MLELICFCKTPLCIPISKFKKFIKSRFSLICSFIRSIMGNFSTDLSPFPCKNKANLPANSLTLEGEEQ